MKTPVPFLSILALSLAAAFSAAACSKAISITDFDTSCQTEIDAQDEGSVCNVECGDVPVPAPVCSAGTCELPAGDGGVP
jgi:hypothetical protein